MEGAKERAKSWKVSFPARSTAAVMFSMGNQWEIFRIRTDGGTLVPYVWPYELWGYSLKFRPDNYRPYISLYMVGTSNLGSWNGHWGNIITHFWATEKERNTSCWKEACTSDPRQENNKAQNDRIYTLWYHQTWQLNIVLMRFSSLGNHRTI